MMGDFKVMITDKISKIRLKAKNFVMFDKGTTAKIDFAGAMLKNAGGVEIPLDYVEFLKNTNGMIAVPFEFFGTDVMERKERLYKFPNIVDINMDFLKNNRITLMRGRIVVGHVYFDMIIFDGNDGKYKLVARNNFATVRVFKDFEEVLGYVEQSL